MKAMLFVFICCCSIALCQEPPRQLLAKLGSSINIQTHLKAIADPMWVPTIAIACCTHNACAMPWVESCVLGTVGSCICLACATECDDSKFPYYSISVLAPIKRGFLSVFPCMKERILAIKKKE